MMSYYLQFLANIGIGGAHPGGLPLTKAVLAAEPIKKSMHILDLGCGTGQTAAFIAKYYGCQVTALDIEKKMLEKAATRFAQDRLDIRIVESSAENLPFKERLFDYVLAESVLAFTEVSKALKQCFYVLKNGGQLIAIEMTKEKEDTLTDEEEQQIKSFYGVKEIMTEHEWYDKMKEAGFEKVQVLNVGDKYSKKGLEELSELKLSQSFDFHALRIWMEHQELMAKLRHRLTYRVYKVRKTDPCLKN